MKRIINLLLALVLIIVSAFTLVACVDNGGDNGKKGLLLKKYAGEDFYTVYGYIDEGENLTSLDIGAVAGDKTVGRIATEAFSDNDTLEEIIVPDTVTEIASGAFQKMKKLSKITLPFVGKTALSDSYIYETDEAEDKSVNGERVFAHVFGTEEYSYGEAVSATFGTEATTVYIPATLTEVTIKPVGEYKIPMYAFAGMTLLQKVNLAGNITAIGQYAFQNCRDLSTINIPASVTTIDSFAFQHCSFLTALTFDEGSNLLEIKESAFANSGVKKVTLPASVSVIGIRAFKNSALQEIVLSAQLTAVKAYAFYGCANLTVVNASAVTAKPILGVSAFEDCENLVFGEVLENLWSVKGANYNKNTKNA